MNTRFDYIITTGCCEAASQHKVVQLGYPYHKDTFDLPYNTRKPVWLANGYKDEYGFASERHIEVTHCPFCGKHVPEIELSTVKKVHESTDGNYCDACKKRNMACSCLPPWFKWKPVGVEITHSVKKRK